MGKLKDIWAIVKRKEWKDGDEVHAVKLNGGMMVSDKLYKIIEPKIAELPKTKSWTSELYGLKITSTPYLPYIYREVKKNQKLIKPL